MKVKFVVPGAPCGKGRPRFSVAGKIARAYTPEKTVRYENLVALAAHSAMGGKPPRQGAVTVEIAAYFPVPKSWSKNRIQSALNGATSPTCRPDADNLAKGICDAMNGICYRDDAQVATLSVEKHYGATPRVEVEVFSNE